MTMYDAINKVIATAKAEVGYLEKKTKSKLNSKTENAGSNNFTKYAQDFDTKYTDFYNGLKNGNAWCDIFVDWCFVQTFGVEKALKLLGQPKKSCGAGCKFSAQYYQKTKRFTKLAMIGNQIFFKNAKGNITHTGLVYNVAGGYVYTIEGNTSSKEGVVANGGAVELKRYSLNDENIYGYGRPMYELFEEDKTMSKDNTPDKYAKADIEWAIKNGILKGTDTGDYRLHSNITIQDALVFIHRALTNVK